LEKSGNGPEDNWGWQGLNEREIKPVRQKYYALTKIVRRKLVRPCGIIFVKEYYCNAGLITRDVISHEAHFEYHLRVRDKQSEREYMSWANRPENASRFYDLVVGTEEYDFFDGQSVKNRAERSEKDDKGEGQ